MSIYSKDKTIMKTIRVSPEENDNWEINRIHNFLAGTINSNDSIRINSLKRYLKGLYDIMNVKMNPLTNLSPNEMDLLLTIEEVIGNE